MALLEYLLPVVMLSAVGAWLLAAWSAISVVRLAPQGQKFRAYLNLGWFRFGRVRELVGQAAEPHIRRYCYAFYIFFAVIISVMLAVTALVVRS
ncbi:MAG: hypothetical protein KDK89_14300 [Alphaproteobacteria bacterium]|nr:hypothetical protein [Alphaproteobacteria bacterium]